MHAHKNTMIGALNINPKTQLNSNNANRDYPLASSVHQIKLYQTTLLQVETLAMDLAYVSVGSLIYTYDF